MIVPHAGARSVPGKAVLLCWKDTPEAARVVSAALPLLKESTSGHTEPGAQLAPWLARHGVKVTVRRDAAIGGDVGALIFSCAAEQGVDLLAMGVYGRSRLRELVLGGVGRTLLSSTTVPLFMAHQEVDRLPGEEVA